MPNKAAIETGGGEFHRYNSWEDTSAAVKISYIDVGIAIMYGGNNYIDLHCHPALKPFGRSFQRTPWGRQSNNRAHRSSLWHYDPPSLTDKLINYAAGLTKFSQSNFTSQARGGVRVICASLYPLERPFVRNKIRNEFLRDLLANLALGVGDRRIDHIQGITDYFSDLRAEYDFFLQCDGREVHLPGGRCRYRLVRSFEEIRQLGRAGERSVQTLCVIPTIEGLHVLNSNLEGPASDAGFLRNLQSIQDWDFPPFFITVAHHFWNHICGHAPSLSGIVARKIDQSEGMGTGITPLGKKVLRAMLSPARGTRILPDLKHMSPRARQEFYGLRSSGSLGPDDFPLLISHGACNGLRSAADPVPGELATSRLMNPVPINFFDDEIAMLARSGGLIGLQLDERRIASPEVLGNLKHSVRRHKIMHYRSALLWNQVQHIAELLDREGLFSWDCMAIGSDFDGIIDSLNGFWTAEELPFLADFLERHAHNYMRQPALSRAENRIGADEIVRRIFSGNAERFLQSHFRVGAGVQ